MDYINYVKQYPLSMGGMGGTIGGFNFHSGGGGGPRGTWAGYAPAGGSIDFVTIQTTGNASNFGNMYDARHTAAGCSNGTRGCMGGGYSPSPVAVIDYITMSTEGNATDFGNLTMAKNRLGALCNATRGVFLPGNDPPQWDVLDYITIANTGNATDFGDIEDNRYEV